MEKQKELVEEEVLEEFEEENTSNQPKETENNGNSNDEEENNEVTLDDLDDVAPSEKFRVISNNDINVLFDVTRDEKGKTVYTPKKALTISAVKLGKVYEKDQEGNVNEPEVNASGGKYFKAKLIVEVEELVNGSRVRIFIPSIFYGVNEDGSIKDIPTIPVACNDDKLDDKFTSELSKVRNLYCKKIGQDAKDVSSSAFVKGLVGKKFMPELQFGEHKKKAWIKMTIKDFA